MKKRNLIGGAFALMAIAVAASKKTNTTSSKVIYADVKEPAPNDHSHSDGGPGGTGTPV